VLLKKVKATKVQNKKRHILPCPTNQNTLSFGAAKSPNTSAAFGQHNPVSFGLD
jgi:hypothetical protein